MTAAKYWGLRTGQGLVTNDATLEICVTWRIKNCLMTSTLAPLVLVQPLLLLYFQGITRKLELWWIFWRRRKPEHEKEIQERTNGRVKYIWSRVFCFLFFCFFWCCNFVIQTVYFCNMSLFLVLVFFRSGVSSMFASAEEVQYFNLILLLSSCLLASPLRSFLRLLESWKEQKQKVLFLTFKRSNTNATEKFFFGNKCCFS